MTTTPKIVDVTPTATQTCERLLDYYGSQRARTRAKLDERGGDMTPLIYGYHAGREGVLIQIERDLGRLRSLLPDSESYISDGGGDDVDA